MTMRSCLLPVHPYRDLLAVSLPARARDFHVVRGRFGRPVADAAMVRCTRRHEVPRPGIELIAFDAL
jgi:hypothetical protein